MLVLFSLGHALEHLAMDRARHAMQALAGLAPKTAMVVRDGTEREVPVGSQVFAGTVNGEGLLSVEVSKLAQDSALARMVHLVAEAQTHKSPAQRFVTKFETVFVPLVLACVLALVVIPPLMGFPFAESFYRAMAVLVAASPGLLAVACLSREVNIWTPCA